MRGAQNPTLTMAAYAKDKGVNGATLRRQFNSMRSLPEFDRLFDLYDTESEVSHNSWPRATSWGPIGDQIAIYGQILTSQDDFHHRLGWEKWE
ncbi:TPA: hypothetical protein ACPJZQ_004171 [Vibrio alginolyticus]